MKYNIQMLCKRTFVLLLPLFLIGNLPIAAFAESTLMDADVLATTPVSTIESTLESGTGGYTYTAPDPGEFVISDTDGTLVIANETATVQFGGFTVTLPNFDYYKIVNTNRNLRFYQADTLKNPAETSDFVYIAISIEDGPVYLMHLQYWVEADNILYNISVELTQNQFSYFDEISTEKSLGTDIVSKRLKSSARIYLRGSFENQNNGETGNYLAIDNGLIAPASLNSIPANTYDNYTDSDRTIREYEEYYFGDCTLEDGFTTTDDPIVDIIPKELCFILGEHIYIGKEYGFFIRVMVDSWDSRDYAVDIMVFDIIHSIPSFPSNTTGGVKVEPLFQFEYRATSRRELDIDPSLPSVVFPHAMYDYPEYYLKDIGMRVTLDNPTALNPGDFGYDPYMDEGAFMIQTILNYNGVGLKKHNSLFIHDTVLCAAGFVPYVGAATNLLSYVYNVHSGFGNSGNYYSVSEEMEQNNQCNIDTWETNNTDQIAAYNGQLIKSKSVTFISDETKPHLIHVGGGYVEMKYVVARKSGSTYNKKRVVSSVSISVVEEETSVWGGTTGELISYGRGTGTYEVGDYKCLSDVRVKGIEDINIPATAQNCIIKMTPDVSGSYKISTISNSGDPNFRITNASKRTETIIATDDINGSSNRNATLTIDLIGGDIYYIEAFRYGTPQDYTLRVGYNPTSTQQLSTYDMQNVDVDNKEYVMFSFVPSVSGNCLFYTDSEIGDPQLFLFDADGALVKSDDDSGEGCNAYLECYLIAGRTYYIAAQGYRGASASFCLVTAPGS